MMFAGIDGIDPPFSGIVFDGTDDGTKGGCNGTDPPSSGIVLMEDEPDVDCRWDLAFVAGCTRNLCITETSCTVIE